MSECRFEALKIENQLCFPLYACSREVIKQYKPFLDELNLTYTQCIAMIADHLALKRKKNAGGNKA